MNSERKLLIQGFVSDISNLAISNRMTGLWDHLRGEICSKSDLNEVNISEIVQTEKKSRHFVEERSRYRTRIDVQFKELLENYIQ